jgi:hypothetical protein
VTSAREEGLDPPGDRGKHSGLEQDREQQILNWIKQNAESNRLVMNKNQGILQESIQFQAAITRGWIKSVILCYRDGIIQPNNDLQEQDLQVSRVFLERTVEDLNEHVQRCLAEQVFRLEDVGIPDWEDRKTRQVVIPAAIGGHTIHPGIFRNVKHISVMACISAAGESLTPEIITLQNSASVREFES